MRLTVRWIWFLAFGLAAASCGEPAPTTPSSVAAQPHASTPATTPSPTNTPPPAEDTAARIARIERGLVPEVRVKGETNKGATIEERLRANHTPGVSVAIIHDYRVISAKAYGIADAMTGARLTETMPLQAASISKMVTAFAALKEVEAKKLSLDTNVNQTLRSWKLPENEFTKATPVTLKHLLSHSANTTVPTLLQEERQPTLLEVLEGKPPAITKPVRVEAAPGSKFRYSGGGTTIVQQLLVDVEGGKPFPELMNELVFAPLKLTHSAFAPPAKGVGASGHDFDGTVVSKNFQPWIGAGGGGLWSTPSDLAQLLVEVQLALRGKPSAVSKELASRLTTPVMQVTKDDSVSTSLGAFIEKHSKGVYFGHDGHGIGFLAMARASTTDGEGAVIMANGASAQPVMLEILRSIAAEYAWEGWLQPPIDLARVDAAHLATLAGRYGAEKNESTIIVVKGGTQLEARQAFRDPLELLPISNNVFVSRSDGSRFTFSTNEAGVRSLVRAPAPWPPGPPATTLTRMPDLAPLEPLQILETGGKLEDAIAAAKKAQAAKDPTVDESKLRTIGEDLLDELDYKRALTVFQFIVALYPKSPIAHIDLAEALHRNGQRAEAQAMATKAKTLFLTDTTMPEYVRASYSWRQARVKALEAKSSSAN